MEQLKLPPQLDGLVPPLLGALIGLFFMTMLLRMGFFKPKSLWEFPEKSSWPSEWLGTLEIHLGDRDRKNLPSLANTSVF